MGDYAGRCVLFLSILSYVNLSAAPWIGMLVRLPKSVNPELGYDYFLKWGDYAYCHALGRTGGFIIGVCDAHIENIGSDSKRV